MDGSGDGAFWDQFWVYVGSFQSGVVAKGGGASRAKRLGGDLSAASSKRRVPGSHDRRTSAHCWIKSDIGIDGLVL